MTTPSVPPPLIESSASAISLQMSTLRTSLLSAKEKEADMLNQKNAAERRTKDAKEELWKVEGVMLGEKRKRLELLEKERELTSLLTYLRSAITSKESLITSTSTLISQLKIIDTENFKEFNNQICKLIGVRGGVEEEEEVFLRRIREMEELEALERIENGDLIAKEERASEGLDQRIESLTTGVKAARKRRRSAGLSLEEAEGRLRKLRRGRRKRD
ncbi:hypothetical protein TL16_g05697 [Triparma laevis f. inornata]|uniref:Uncharacterized protein n=1 Tax=Triparma laevis f. inornata TaxID=1714386 RepID=A0A9W7APK6_9STRA|nr:hypothetical protein TL16_g05697 [Triparma laevis f. inornata]